MTIRRPIRLIERPCSGGCGRVFGGCSADEAEAGVTVTCIACAFPGPPGAAEKAVGIAGTPGGSGDLLVHPRAPQLRLAVGKVTE